MNELTKKPPISSMYWSEGEKDAFRRNRVVLTRFHMIMEDIGLQESAMHKTFRYETHKFRQTNSKYFPNTCKPTGIDTPVGIVTVPPSPTPSLKPYGKGDLDEIGTSYSESDIESSAAIPNRGGIITRSKKPCVKFSVFNDVIENVDTHRIADENEGLFFCKGKSRNTDDYKLRSLSAVPYKEVPELPGMPVSRYYSAQASTRLTTNDRDCASSPDSHFIINNDMSRTRGSTTFVRPRFSDIFFDKSKAAYQLRQELHRRAKLRKQGVAAKVVTIRDVLHLERDKYKMNQEKVVQFIKRLEKDKNTKHVAWLENKLL